MPVILFRRHHCCIQYPEPVNTPAPPPFEMFTWTRCIFCLLSRRLRYLCQYLGIIFLCWRFRRGRQFLRTVIAMPQPLLSYLDHWHLSYCLWSLVRIVYSSILYQCLRCCHWVREPIIICWQICCHHQHPDLLNTQAPPPSETFTWTCCLLYFLIQHLRSRRQDLRLIFFCRRLHCGCQFLRTAIATPHPPLLSPNLQSLK